MSKIYSPKIVTDSLVMCLDASNNKSYPTDFGQEWGRISNFYYYNRHLSEAELQQNYNATKSRFGL